MSNWNDGGVPFGSRKVTFYAPLAGKDANGNSQWAGGATRGIGILEVNSVERTQYTQRRYDEVRNPNGSFGVDEFTEFSATYQLANVNSQFIQTGDAFTTTLSSSAGATAESYVCISAGSPEEQGGIKKQSLRCQKIYVASSLPAAYP